jgi:hypothetical protein
MKIRLLAVLYIAIFINPCLIFAENMASTLYVSRTPNCIWRVYSAGNIEKVSCFQDAPLPYKRSVYHGSNLSCIAPDKSHVAVIRNDDLWVFDVDKKNLIRITEVAKPYTKEYLSIDVKIISWSWDSQKLLYSINPGDAGSGDDAFDRKERLAKYGSYIYDVKDKAKIFVPTSIDQLFPNFNRVIFSYDKDGTTLIDGHKINKKLNHYQMDISRDGKWLVANTEVSSEASKKEPRSQIVKIDLENFKITPITPIGAWAEYQWPKFSPSGKKILYEWQNDNGKPMIDIAVDGNRIYSALKIFNLFWIDDNTIAFTSTNKNYDLEIFIINSDTGKVNGQQMIYERKVR